MVPWTKVLLGVLGFAVVVILIAVPTAIYLNEEDDVVPEDRSKKNFTLEDVFNSSYSPRSYAMRWISDSEYLTWVQGSVYLNHALTNTSELFLSKDKFDRVEAYDYQLSADRQYVAFMSNYSKVWRHSFTASYHIYDLNTGTYETLPHHSIMYFSWAPEGHKMAYVWQFNVYIKSPAVAEQPVTTDGEYNKILNGVPDWVYEEEMFSSNQGLWWSPGGRYLAYAHTNDTQVENIEYSWYGSDQYPYTVVIPYPKPGTTNPVVKLFVADATDPKNITEVVVPTAVAGPSRTEDHYLSTVTWATDQRLAVQWQKRKQNYVLLQIYELRNNIWTETEGLLITSATGWVGRFSPSDPVFSADKSSYYFIKSGSNGFKHLHHAVSQGTNVTKTTAITTGQWEVIDILKVTADSVYYTSNEVEGKPGGRNVYRYPISGGDPVCLTCGLPDLCMSNSAYFSHNASFYRMGCHGPAIPRLYIRDNRQETPDSDRCLKHLEENLEFEELIKEVNMPTVRLGTIPIAGEKLWYKMTLPPFFDEKKKYPLLIDVYAGPCSQKVDYRYRTGWSAYLASTERVIVASFDGRGSGYQGDKVMHALYNKLGTLEVEDQITAVREFVKMGFIDETRIAIWGWSYGGYVTSRVLGSPSINGLFKCGIAVAPVSKWEYYDSIYTERYMNLPKDNGYYWNTTVTELAKNFHNVEYLLIHGTADDNVHFQQAAQISKALVEEQVDFEAMWYTDKDHGIEGAANKHIYTHMSHFLQRCFAVSST